MKMKSRQRASEAAAVDVDVDVDLRSVAKNAHVKSACKNVDSGRCCPFTHTHVSH